MTPELRARFSFHKSSHSRAFSRVEREKVAEGRMRVPRATESQSLHFADLVCSRRVSLTVGRFAPSPTGPLHRGSLVAAVASWLYARADEGRWLVRIEDIDTPRVIPGSADEILAALLRYELEWDGEIVWQSQRTALYEDALEKLRADGKVYDCGCSRAELQRTASAPLGREPVYPGTCRDGLAPGKVARAIRFRVPDERIAFRDRIAGRVEENVAEESGDFVIRRADGLFAYQLAVVVDDGEQGVTQVVRGADLLASTARQIALQRALALPEPQYAHVPLITNPDGSKLGKREGALALPTLDETHVRATLAEAMRHLGYEVEPARPRTMLEEALRLQRERNRHEQ
jgi:glutamyl-Q tRNA(Asp) synthetase